jgi:hypothetical protein
MFDFINTLLKRPSIRDRRYARNSVEARAELYFTERRYAIAGMVIELSQGGALFREASRYIMDRKRAVVVLRVGPYEIPGTIVNVRAVGYGIRFDSPVSDDVINELAGALQDAAA